MAEPNHSSREAKQLIRQTRRYFIFGVMSLAVLWSLIIAHPQTAMAEDGASKPITLNIRVVDEQGIPVAEAYLGLSLFFDSDDNSPELPIDETGWQYLHAARSDREGRAEIPLKDGIGTLKYHGLIARHPGRRLMGVAIVDPDEPRNDPVTVTLQPACRIVGKVTCRQRTDLGLSFSFADARLSHSDRQLMQSNRSDHAFELWAPPGDYEFTLYGERTHEIRRKLQITPEDREIDLGEMNLPACKYGLMQGQPAPELRDVVAWQNSEPLTMSGLRGRWVLLEFWGRWCGNCLPAIPLLNRLHQEYGEKELTIIGLHAENLLMGRRAPEYKPVETPEALKADFERKRQKYDFWKTLADPQYPIAFERAVVVPYGEGVDEEAISIMGAEYGIVAYPTGILIDPEGRVVEFLDVRSPEQYHRLEAYLHPPADALSPIFAKAQP